jgi:hypothetical protein
MDSLPDLIARVTRFPALCAALGDLISVLEAADGAGCPFFETERCVVSATRAVGVAAVSEALRTLDPGVPRIVVDEVEYRRMREPSVGRYVTLDGAAEVPRHLYRQVGVRNGPTVDPIAVQAGLIDGMTPCAVEAVGQLVQALPTREAHEVASTMRVLGLSRASLYRRAESLGASWEEDRFEGADTCVRAIELPTAAAAISVSVDRVSTPMAEPKPRPVGRPRKNAPKRPLDVVYRMAYCGVITWYDADGKPLGCIRYGEMPTDEASALLESRMRDDLGRLLDGRPDLKLVTLADGAPEMQHLLDRITSGHDVTARLVDFWHAVEYLAAALAAICAPPETIATWRRKLRDTQDGGRAILLRLQTLVAERGDDIPEPLFEAVRYFTNQQDRMGYAAARSAGLPIGSGTVEATCKTLVTMRMKRPGARWTLDGGQAILSLRSLATSGLWTTAAHFLVRRATRDVQTVAAA